ncbi:rod-binding protein [Burkholderia gladioli]|uniref:rod-binding protein n=1 Tax=Burkholderia gladioli TaxID=28095 RepID=UPI0034DAF829
MTNNTTADLDRDIAHLIDNSENGIARVPRETLARLRALLTSPRAAVPGQGWKLVPEIPTVEMLDAALPGDDTFGRGFKTRIYQEMLDAAPAAPAAPVAEPASQGVIAAALAVIECDRAQVLTDAHIDALDNAIKIQRGDAELPVAAQAVAADGEATDDLIGRLLLAGRHPDFAICMEAATAIQRAAVSPATDDERAAFEECIRAHSDPDRIEDRLAIQYGGYVEYATALAWEAWQARASQAAAPAEAISLLRKAHRTLACAALTQIRDGEAVWTEIGRFLDAAPADAALSNRVSQLEKALVYVGHRLHDTPQYMLCDGVALIDNDGITVKAQGIDVAVSLRGDPQPTKAAAPAEAISLLRKAHRTLACAALTQIRDGEAVWTEIGRFLDAAPADAALSNRVSQLEKALVYVGHRLHDTPQYMLCDGVALIDNDGITVKAQGIDVAVSLRGDPQPTKAAAPAEAISLLRKAHRTLACAALTQIRDGEAVWTEIGRFLDAAPADAALSNRVSQLEKALVYVGHRLHDTPQYMLCDGVALIDNDGITVKAQGIDVAVSLRGDPQPTKAAAPAEAISLLRKAHRTLACAALTQIRDGEAVWTEIGRFLDAAPADAREPIYQSRLLKAPAWTDVSRTEFEACAEKPDQFETRTLCRVPADAGEAVASEITDAMIDAARPLFLALECGATSIDAVRHQMRQSGVNVDLLPKWFSRDSGHLTKAGRAIIAWHLMKGAQGGKGGEA